MLKENMPYSAADWRVRSGSEGDFVQAWKEFIQWTSDEAAGAGTFHLLRDARDPNHFMSFGSWESMDDLQAWGQHERFAELYDRCVALCDEVNSGPFLLAAGQRTEG